MEQPTPEVSVVVAVRNFRHSLRECLNQLALQAQSRDVEIIVVDASTDGSAQIASEFSTRIKLLRADPQSLVPQLWSLGIEASAAPLVALTIGQCVAEPRWIDDILAMAASHEGSAGFGGAIDPPRGGRWRDWALYFSRYSAYMPPLIAAPTLELAGDNAAYRKSALAACEYAETGFWENLIHHHVRSLGWTLSFSAGMRVRLGAGVGALQFCRERYRHGLYFGSTRPGDSVHVRLIRVLTAPAVAPYLVARIGLRVARHRRDWLLRYASALPWLMLFVASWSIGEAVGYLTPRTRP